MALWLVLIASIDVSIQDRLVELGEGEHVPRSIIVEARDVASRNLARICS